MKARTQFLVRFGYFGDPFSGVQPLRDRPTAGGALYERLVEAFGVPPKALCFSARTDRGVHALDNMATFFIPDEGAHVSEAARAVERARDDGLTFVRLFAVSRHVHARGTARGKRYRYIVDDMCADADDPHHPKSLYSWRIAPAVDVDRARSAAALLVGERDFSSFRSGPRTDASPVKHISRITVRGPYALPAVGRRIFIEVIGDGFLRKMVRNIAGLLVEVGSGWRDVDDIPRILAARDRSALGITAPPGGLTLVEVYTPWRGAAPPDDVVIAPSRDVDED
jgi:tRNA pseudouridine38-40 synthase